jgi:ribosomal RNA-processing protein 17
MAPPSKRRKVANSKALDEIVFDTESRAEFLTGFHKRKVARAKHAQEVAAKKDREYKIRARAEVSFPGIGFMR